MTQSPKHSPWSTPLIAISAFTLYFLGAKYGLTFAMVNPSASAIWTPSGIALATFLLFGEQYWPAIYGAAFLANYLTTGVFVSSLLIAGGNTMEALVGSLLIHQYANGPRVFDRAIDILKFAIIIEPISTFFSPTVGVTALCLNDQASWSQYSTTWFTWWVGDLSGALIFTPFLILWAHNPRVSIRQAPWFLLSLALIGLASEAVFGDWFFHSGEEAPELEFFCIPPMMWIAYRFEGRDTSLASLLLTVIGLWNTLHHNGPYVKASMNESLLLLQAYMSVVSTTSLSLAAAVSERNIAEENLTRATRAEKELKERISQIELLRSISVAANESADLPEAIQIALEQICRYTGWPVGHVYYPDPSGRHLLVPGSQWFIRDERKFSNFKKATLRRNLQPGDGLAGSVYLNGEPLWMEDLHQQDRGRTAWDPKVRSGFAFPVTLHKNVFAVLEFFTDFSSSQNHEWLETMKQVGVQLGRVSERQRYEQTQKQLAMLVEGSTDFIVTADPEGFILYLNEAGRTMVGLEKDFNVNVLKHEDFLFHADIPKLRREILPAIVEKGHWEGEFILKNFKTGDPVHVYFSAGVLRDPKTNNPTTLTAIGHNLTDLRKAEEAIKNSQKQFQLLIENALDVVTIMDAQGRITYISPNVKTQMGYDPSELTNVNAFDLIHPEDVSQTFAVFRSLLEDPSQPQITQYRFKHKDGHWVPFESIGRNILSNPIIRGVVVNSRNMTEQKRAQNEIQRTNNFLTTILDNIPNMVFVKDARDLKFVMFNKAGEDLLGVPRQDLMGKNDHDFFTKEQADFFISKDRIVLKEGRLIDIPEEPIQSKTKGTRVLHTKKIPVLNEEGNPQFLLGISEDITDAKQAQRAMQEQAVLLRSIVDNMGEGLLVCDEKGKTLFANPATEMMLKGQVGDPLPQNHPLKNMVYWGDAETLIEPKDFPITRALNGESSDNVELFIKNDLNPSGIYILVTSRPIRNNEGRITGAVSVFRDITEQKRNEEERQRLVTLVQHSRDMIVWSTPEGKNLYINEAGRKMIGVDLDQPASTIQLETIAPLEEIEQVKKIREIQHRSLREKGFWEGELSIPHQQTGRPVPIHFSIVTLKNPKTGRPIGSATIGRDMTERREAEKIVREADMRFRAMIQSSPNAIIVAEKNGFILSWNTGAEKIFGYTEKEILGKPFTTIMPPQFREIHEQDLQSVREDKTSRFIGHTLELTGLRKDGTDFPIELTLSSWKVEKDLYFGGIIRDITERKKMEELLRSNTELQQFANVASHDLQEPLRMVASYVQLLAEHFKNKLDPDAQEYMSYAVDGAKRMQMLVNGLLEYSRVESRGKPLQWTDMNQVFDQTIANIELRVAETRAKIDHDPLPNVMGDPVQLTQLLQNLFSNAIKFQNKNEPVIHLSVQEKEKDWLFSCKDNGIGLDPKYADRIFVIFQRLHHRNEYSGTGIGLAICKRIVERHGGRIWVESKPNEGATFHFTLPKRSN